MTYIEKKLTKLFKAIFRSNNLLIKNIDIQIIRTPASNGEKAGLMCLAYIQFTGVKNKEIKKEARLQITQAEMINGSMVDIIESTLEEEGLLNKSLSKKHSLLIAKILTQIQHDFKRRKEIEKLEAQDLAYKRY